MGKLTDLTAGKKFTAAGLQKQLKSGTRGGELSSLSGHQDALRAIAKKRQGAIRSGQYDSSRRTADYREVLKTSGKISEQKNEISKDCLNI